MRGTRGVTAVMTAAGFLAIVLPGGARAQERPQSPALTCAGATALVRGAGALILGTGGATYDRYVAGPEACQAGEVAETASVPTRDAPQCVVGYRCAPRLNQGEASQ